MGGSRFVAALVVVAAVGAGASAVGASADVSAKVLARYPADNGSMVETTVLTPADVANASRPRERSGTWRVPVTLTDAGAESFSQQLRDAGFTSDAAVGNCPTTSERNDEGYCLLTVVDGEVVFAAAMSEGFANQIRSGDFAADPQFLLLAANETTANRLADAFGAPPANNTTTNSTGTTAEDVITPVENQEQSSGGSPGFGMGSVVAALAAAGVLAGVRGRLEA